MTQVAMMDFAVSVREAFRFIFRDSNFGAKSSREQKIRWRQICITTELNLNLKVHYIHVHDANWPCSYISLVWCYVPVIICFISSGGILGGGFFLRFTSGLATFAGSVLVDVGCC